ncbi:pyridoxamine 5'-phosphate oxidase family protein [Microlunatus elymi]|uniref:Pyridoxamine 5'-phosphate oxidase family protein n=1 Tax=Microlunatus elymi TaxID=2596828 RepID=A0A516Q0Y6_9ACTN|nr:pyridoxamine 5'-phosphate oxidase family protein [Microlunatus elymi]QDP96871.1 pyridoxamine 5'-phosphate oxidase family protein [Microlunatus elymi]
MTFGASQQSTRPATQPPDRKDGPLLAELDHHECVVVLTEQTVGRIGWKSPDGQLILPVNFAFLGTEIGFRTSPYGPLAELVRPTPVAFEVDHLDERHLVAESVLIQGVSHAASNPDWVSPDWSVSVVPWAGGQRRLSIEITIHKITGRRITRG